MSETAEQRYAVRIEGLYTSPGHNYYGQTWPQIGAHPLVEHERVRVEADKGIPGDRFYDTKPDFDGQVTFLNAEVIDAVAEALQDGFIDPRDFRRNIVLRGVPVVDLIGARFTLGGVAFMGAKHCAPCKWMNAGVGDGALTALRGRGGLRAKVLTTGELALGETALVTAATLDPTAGARPLAAPELP